MTEEQKLHQIINGILSLCEDMKQINRTLDSIETRLDVIEDKVSTIMKPKKEIKCAVAI